MWLSITNEKFRIMHFPLQIQEEIYSTTIFSDKAGKLILVKIIYNIRITKLIIYYLHCGSLFSPLLWSSSLSAPSTSNSTNVDSSKAGDSEGSSFSMHGSSLICWDISSLTVLRLSLTGRSIFAVIHSIKGCSSCHCSSCFTRILSSQGCCSSLTFSSCLKITFFHKHNVLKQDLKKHFELCRF